MTLQIQNNSVEAPLYSLVSESSVTKKLTDNMVISSDAADIEPAIGLTIKGSGRDTYCAIIHPGTKGKMDIIPVRGREVLNIKAQTKKINLKISRDTGLLTSVDMQRETLLSMTEECMVDYISDIDTAFLNKLYDLAPTIHSKRVRITKNNIMEQLNRINSLYDGGVSSAILFTDTDNKESITELHSLVSSSMPKNITVSVLPIGCLGLPSHESVLMLLPNSEILGMTYYAQLPTSNTSSIGTRVTVDLYETSVTVLMDIMAIAILC